MKRTLLLIALAIVLIGIGVGVYFYFFSNSPSVTGQPGSLLPSSGDANGDSGGQTTTAQELGVPVSQAGTEIAPRLIRISDKPVVFGSKALFLPGKKLPTSTTTQSTGTTPYSVDPDVLVAYLDRESGNVFNFMAHARTLTRVSNKTLPAIQEAVWSTDASLAFVRLLEKTSAGEQINTFALPSDGNGGYVLERNISSLYVTGSSTLVTLLPTTGGSVATIASISGVGARTLFTSALASLRLSIGGGSTIATTKASSKASGYAFLVTPKDGSFVRLLGPLTGLTTTVSPSGKFLLYSYLEGGKLTLAVFDITTHTATRLPLSTLPEKCVWSSDSQSIFCGVPTNILGTYPDDWYQGATASSDRLWRIDLPSRVATQVIDLQTVGAGAVDAVSLDIDKNSDVLIFTNRNDGSLWMYDL